MLQHIEIWLRKLHIKTIRFINGDGFTMPEVDPKERCMYNYCKLIINNEEIDKIQAYEDEIKEVMEEYPKVTRENVANIYVKSLEWVYGKENI